MMMKTALSLLVAAAAMPAPLMSFAQTSNVPVTRVEVVAQLSSSAPATSR